MIKQLAIIAALFSALAAVAQTTQPMLQPHQTFVDGSGAPCSGCSLYSYAAGTTTSLATYTDASGATPNTNPVILDVAGGAQVWLGAASYKFILKDSAGSTIWTVDNVNPVASIENLGGPYLPMAGGALSGSLTSSSTIGGVWTVNCLGSEDTAQFNTVATAAGAAAGANNIQTVHVSGNCVVGGQVNLPSHVHWQGSGSTVTVPSQTGTCHYTFLATNADDVAFEGFTIKVTNSPGGDLACYNAIQWIDSAADSAAHAHVYIRDNTIINSVWGIYVEYAHGSGSLTDVDISGNTISSPPGSYSNGDGIHVDGKVSMLTITHNRISYRNDAAIGITSNGAAYPQSGAIVSDNILIEDRVGLDCSGCTNTEWSHNYVRSTLVPAAGQCPNPSYRQIYFASTFPTGVVVHDNYLNSALAGAACAGVPVATANLDPAGAAAWPVQGNAFKNNVIDGRTPPFYARGNTFTVEGNTFVTGGQFTLDYDPAEANNTKNVIIGRNTWLQAGTIVMGAGCANYANIQVQPQEGAVTYTNLPCLGTQTFSTPGDVLIGGNLVAPAGDFVTYIPGTGALFDSVWRDPTNSTNHMILDNTGNLNVPLGWIATAQYFKMGGGATGGLRNAAGDTVVPGAVDVMHGSASTHIQMSDGSGTTGNCPQFAADGSLTDSGAGCGTAPVPAQYKIKSFDVRLGDGLAAISAGTYPIMFQAFNDTGVTYTITGISCASDNAGTSTGTVANNSGTALLTGAINASPTWATGTQSATTTLANGAWANWTIIADGTSKQIQCRMKGTY